MRTATPSVATVFDSTIGRVELIWDIALLTVGLLLVCKGGDLFVDSSVQIAANLRIPRIIVGGTIVSLATTLPELMVSVTASLMKNPGIALGNAVGSVIANIGLILGVSALFAHLVVEKKDFKRRSIWMIGSALLVIVFTVPLYLNRFLAFVLFLVSLAYLYFDYQNIRTHRSQKTAELVKAIEPQPPMRKSALFFLLGAVLVLVGSRVLVQSAVSLAEALGIPSIVIGLSIVAVGTSLPELVTALTAVKKGVHDLSIGNVIGANVLNLAMIVGVSGMIHPLTMSRSTQFYSFPWLLAFVFLIATFFWKEGKLDKKGGIILLVLYSIYLVGLFILPF